MFKRLTVQGDGFDVYDVPESPPPAKRAKNGSWRPWDLAQNEPGNTIHVSTPNRRTDTTNWKESSLSSKQHATPRSGPTMIKRIHEALKTKPKEGLTIDGILDWIRTNQSTYYHERGKRTVQNAIRTTLKGESKRIKRTVWEYADGTWRLDEAILAGLNTENSTESYAEEDTEIRLERQTHTPSALAQSSTGGQTSDATPELLESMPRSTLQDPREGDHEDGQDVPPVTVSSAESIHNQPRSPAPETDAHEIETLQADTAVPGAPTADSREVDPNETFTQQPEAPAESTSTIHNDKPNSTEEGRGPLDSCDGPGQEREDESYLGEIVKKLRDMKQERHMREQKIKAGHESLPDFSVLTQSVREAQHVADEAQRAADEAQRVAEAANIALEEGLAKQRQIVAAELDLETLIRNSDLLRSTLDID